jgi:colicin import membrane protein
MDQEVAILPTQDLTIIPTDIRLRVFTTPGAIEPWLDHVSKSVAGFTPDTSTPRGRANIKSMAFEVTKSKTYLTKVGKELADEQKAIPKLIDATRKHITETLEALAVSVRQPLTDWEVADEERAASHRAAIASYMAFSQPSPELPAVSLKGDLAFVEGISIDAEHCEEFLSEYQRARDAAVLILKTLIPIREASEADRAELIQLRAAAAARNERDRFEAELLENVAAEKARTEEAAARKIEDDRIAAENAARLVREAEERIFREAEEAKAREAEEALRRANDAANVEAINNEVIRSFIGAGFSEMDAVAALGLIASGSIPYVTITY